MTQIESDIASVNGTAQLNRNQVIKLGQDDIAMKLKVDEMDGNVLFLTTYTQQIKDNHRDDKIIINADLQGNVTALENVDQIQANEINLLRTDLTHDSLDLYSKVNANEVNVSNLITANQTQSDQIDENNRIIYLQMDVDNRHTIEISNLQSDVIEINATGIKLDIAQNQDDISHNFDMNHANKNLNDDLKAQHNADIEILQDEDTALHLRDTQIESKMFMEHISITERFMQVDGAINGTLIILGQVTDTHNSRIEIHDSAISDIQMTNSRQSGDIATLQSEMSTIGTGTSQFDEQQNLRLGELESEYNSHQIQIEGLIGTLQGFGVRMAGFEQSIDGLIDELDRVWNEFAAVWRDIHRSRQV